MAGGAATIEGNGLATDGRPQRRDAAPLVVHVFPSFAIGGAQARFAALANHFGGAFRHRVVSLDGTFAARERLRPDLEVDFPTVPGPKGATFANARYYRRLLRQWQPDLLVTGNWGAIEWAMANLPPLVRHVHIEDGFGPEERAGQIARRVWTRRVVLARSTVVLPSRKLLRIAAETWRLPRQRLRHLPNGIDLARFARPRTANAIPVIGTVAALREEKNLTRLLRAVAALQTPVQTVIVGDGPQRPLLEDCARDLGIADRVRFVGQVDDPAPYYAEFDIFALSSDTEQMPLSVMEAMAAALPVAATDVGDVRTMLSEANAPFVGRIDTTDLTQSLVALLRDAPQRAAIGAANRAKAHAEFDQAAMFRAYGALWRGDNPDGPDHGR